MEVFLIIFALAVLGSMIYGDYKATIDTALGRLTELYKTDSGLDRSHKRYYGIIYIWSENQSKEKECINTAMLARTDDNIFFSVQIFLKRKFSIPVSDFVYESRRRFLMINYSVFYIKPLDLRIAINKRIVRCLLLPDRMGKADA